MKKFEYTAFVTYGKMHNQNLAAINAFGQEGWEIASSRAFGSETQYIFKREVLPILDLSGRKTGDAAVGLEDLQEQQPDYIPPRNEKFSHRLLTWIGIRV